MKQRSISLFTRFKQLGKNYWKEFSLWSIFCLEGNIVTSNITSIRLLYMTCIFIYILTGAIILLGSSLLNNKNPHTPFLDKLLNSKHKTKLVLFCLFSISIFFVIYFRKYNLWATKYFLMGFGGFVGLLLLEGLQKMKKLQN